MVFDAPIEIDVLLSCARPQITPERAATVREVLQNGIDWEYLFRVARRHGLVSLLYYQLSTVCPESVPGALLNRLKTRFHANLAHNLFLTAELLKLLSLLKITGSLPSHSEGRSLRPRSMEICPFVNSQTSIF